jgi:uncharacterized membrane protein YsdA (DUF1294 family)
VKRTCHAFLVWRRGLCLHAKQVRRHPACLAHQKNALHLWSLAGGWPGAWFAQLLLGHKSRKQSFRMMYWLTVVLHCAALSVWLYPAAITSFTTPALTAYLVTPSCSIANTPRPLV